jgi:hypothetical protein
MAQSRMSRQPWRGKPRLGLALSADRITAVVPDTDTQVSVPWALTASAEHLDALSSALDELRLQLSAATGLDWARVSVDVALLPPLAEARLIALPPLRKAEAEQVVRRDAARFFVGPSTARALAVLPQPRTPDGPAPVLAASASAALIEQLHAALAGLGWRVRSVVPAVACWLSAAARGAERGPRLIVAQVDDTLHLMRIDGSLRLLRRAPLSSWPELVETVGTGPGRALILAHARQRTALTHGLAAAQWQVEEPPAGGDAALTAAHFASQSNLELVPQSVQLERQAEQRKRARRFALTATLLMVASGLVELWGTRRELSALRAQRAAIRQEVAPLLTARDSINTLVQRRAHIDGLQLVAPRWTSALFELAMLLPADTHVRSLRATGDTVVIEATSARAGDAVQALRSSTTLRDVRLKGQVERELEDGATALERFSLQARLVPLDSVPAPPDSLARSRAGGTL